jgi:stringent starvation protein B
MYEWIVDNGLTPHMLVFADEEGVIVPREYVDDGKIVLNVNPTAVRGLTIGNEEITFSGRFGGKPMDIVVPVNCAVAIYARENGKGMVFSPEDGDTPTDPDSSPDSTGESKDGGRPALRIVK